MLSLFFFFKYLLVNYSNSKEKHLKRHETYKSNWNPLVLGISEFLIL
jgi:hypothetical protein